MALFEAWTRSAAEIRTQVGRDIWQSYFKFCVERNPWDKTLSYYHMMNGHQGGGLTLGDFLAGNDFPVNAPKYTDPVAPDRIIVDRVLRYEQLTDELARVFGELEIPFGGSLGVNAKSEYRADRRPYQEVYTAAQATRPGGRSARDRVRRVPGRRARCGRGQRDRCH